VALAHQYPSLYATVGIHPNDCTANWYNDFKKIVAMMMHKEKNKIVGIGECGIDLHYPDSNLDRQRDAFKAHIETALEHDLALVIHSRDSYDETLFMLDQFKKDIKRATIHCFSYDRAFAQHVVTMGLVIGIDAPLTYPKNDELRAVVKEIGLEQIVLETDAPFLPPQHLRGKQNHPLHIKTIAEYIAQLLNVNVEEVAQKTTNNAKKLFNL
jgi:TatD DNase family protein